MLKRLITGLLCIGIVTSITICSNLGDQSDMSNLGQQLEPELYYGGCPPLLMWLCGK